MPDNEAEFVMKMENWLKMNVSDGKELIDSGYAGAHQAVKEALQDEAIQADLSLSAHNAWKAVAIGACVGSVGGYLTEDERPVRSALAGALLGGALAVGGLMAWGTRGIIAAAVSGAARSVHQTRDEQWLDHNPVAYG
jgi:hypothetical protein